MSARRPLGAALAAALWLAVFVIVFGNEWWFEEVVLEADSNLARTWTQLLHTFSWRFTSENEQTSTWAAGWLAILVLLGLVLLVVWVIARRASGFALFIGAWGAVVLVSMVAGFLQLLIAYGELFPAGTDFSELGRFWYSFFNGSGRAAQWGLLFGAGAGVLAALVGGSAGAVPSPAPPAPEGWYVQPASPTTQYSTVDPSADPTTVMGIPSSPWAPEPSPPVPPPPPASPWDRPQIPGERSGASDSGSA